MSVAWNNGLAALRGSCLRTETTVICALGLLGLVLFPAETFAKVTMALTSGTGAQGQTVDIFATVTGGTLALNNITNLDATIQFPSAQVSAGSADVSAGSVLSGHGGVWTPGPGPGFPNYVDVSANNFSSGANVPANTTGELVDFRFHILPSATPGTYALILVNNSDWNTDIGANSTFFSSPVLQSGSITITQSPSAGLWKLPPQSGSWAVGSNWSDGNVPSASTSATVTFSGTPSTPINVTLDGNQSARAIMLNTSGSAGYVISRGTSGNLTLGTSAGGSIRVVGSATHRISANALLAGNLSVSTSGGGSLEMSGTISDFGLGSALTLSGGELILSGTGSYTGGTMVTSGSLMVTNLAALPVDQSLSVASGGAVIFNTSLGLSIGSALTTPFIDTLPTSLAASRYAKNPQFASTQNFATVPEPSTWLLLTIAVIATIVVRKPTLGLRSVLKWWRIPLSLQAGGSISWCVYSTPWGCSGGVYRLQDRCPRKTLQNR